jgi:hypothetical protein
MQAAYRTSPPESSPAFAAADEQYEAIKRQLLENEQLQAPHNEIEDLLQTQGRELLRRLLQGHLALRSTAEPVEQPVVGDDEVERTHRREGTVRNLMSIFGEVQVERVGFSARHSSSRFVLDSELNLPPEDYSLGVRRRAAVEAAQSSFDRARANLSATTGAEVPKRQLQQLVARAAQDFDAYYEATALSQSPQQTGSLLIQTFDATGITVHIEDLREATRAQAVRAAQDRAVPENSSERAHRKRMVAVAAVYTLEPWVRTARDIVHALAPLRLHSAEAERPKPEYKRVWASVLKDAETVIRQSFEEAQSRDPKHTKRWIVLVDGEPHQLRLVKKMAKEFGVRLTIVVDFIHVTQYLWKAARVLQPDDKAQSGWVSERLIRILEGKVGDVAAGMRRSATRRALEPSVREPVDECANYLLKYKAYLRYHQYLQAGLPIATGVIEGACRHLVKDRMELTGAKWRLVSAEAILKLRALQCSADFDEYWAFHLQQESRRNHASLYAQQRIPLLRLPENAPALRLLE